MTEEQRAAELHRKIAEAASIREMCKSPGFELLRKSFRDKLQKATQRMIDPNTTDEQVKEIRRKIQVWTEIENELKHLILNGAFSEKMLRQFEDLDSSTTPANLSGQQI